MNHQSSIQIELMLKTKIAATPSFFSSGLRSSSIQRAVVPGQQVHGKVVRRMVCVHPSATRSLTKAFFL